MAEKPDKTGMGSAWLQTKHVHAGRPGVPAPVMIKRNPIFHHLWRSEQYSAFAFFISQSKSDFHYQHIIRVPAGLLALKSCSCCCCPLPFKLRLFLEPICKVFYFEGCPAWTCFEVMHCPYQFFSQAWIWYFLLVIKTMSVNLSIGLCCVHCLQVLRFERGNANSKQSNTIIASQLSQSLHRHTAPTENNIYIIIYI